MSAFVERLRNAVGADYEILDEVASGGMGIVYRARDLALDRLVAIKVMHPGLATAAASERFLREARALASFRHPNIVPVHRAGEADGIAWYVMDYLDGETLAERIKRGPLPPAEFARCADDLLAALAAVHDHGIVHRDVKPANVFLSGGRAVLSDFGISKPTSPDITALTAPGHIVGTPGYMPPEQLAAGDVGPRTDVCAAAMVLFEAATGRLWTFDSHTEQADWSGVPAHAVAAIRRGLAWAPGDRWATAGEFRAALGAAQGPSRRPRPLLISTAAAAVLVIAVYLVWPRPSPTGAAVRVRIHPFSAAAGAPPGLGDSLAAQLVRALPAAPDIAFFAAGPGAPDSADLDVNGSVSVAGDTVRVHLDATGPGSNGFRLDKRGPATEIVDSLGHGMLVEIWRLDDRVGAALPVDALPVRTDALLQWARGEVFYARAQWTSASEAYERALALDSTCRLCDLRLTTTGQWQRISVDPQRAQRLRQALARFTPPYQLAIRSMTEPDPAARWALRDSLIARYPRFDLGYFLYGDELFHRGALAGRSRAMAAERFHQVTTLREHFAPAWEHRAWVAAAEGDEVTASSALERFAAEASPTDIDAAVVRAIISVGTAWRFDPGSAVATTEYVLGSPAIANLPDLAHGPRYLLVFDAPDGVLWLGRRFERWPEHPELKSAGLVAQIVAHLASGRVDSARAVMRALAGRQLELDNALVAAEFDAAQVLFAGESAAAALPRLDATLGAVARAGAATPLQQRRAAWMMTLLARRAGASDRDWRKMVGVGSSPFATLLDADAAARTDPQQALTRSAPLLALDSGGVAGDPFFRSALHLLRSEWHLAAGDTATARLDLLWHENYDIVSSMTNLVQAIDVDWAFGTLARWRRARIAPAGGGDELCRALGGVARLWARGDGAYRIRAAMASGRSTLEHCPAS